MWQRAAESGGRKTGQEIGGEVKECGNGGERWKEAKERATRDGLEQEEEGGVDGAARGREGLNL